MASKSGYLYLFEGNALHMIARRLLSTARSFARTGLCARVARNVRMGIREVWPEPIWPRKRILAIRR